MMLTFKKLFIPMTVFALLAGCDEKLTTVYLLEHPAYLKQQVEQCQSQPRDAQCAMIMSAAATIMSTLNAQQQNAEGFGQRVLDLEMTCVKSTADVESAQKTLQSLQAAHASQAALNTASNNLQQAKTRYQAQHDELKILLAVIGLSSPE